MVGAAPIQPMASPFGAPMAGRIKRSSADEVSVSRMASNGGKKRRSKNVDEQQDLVRAADILKMRLNLRLSFLSQKRMRRRQDHVIFYTCLVSLGQQAPGMYCTSSLMSQSKYKTWLDLADVAGILVTKQKATTTIKKEMHMLTY